MKKLFFLLPTFLLGITTYPDFSMCYNKFKNYSVIPISKHYSITSIKPKQFLKYDENLGLYLIKTNNKTYLKFKKSHLGVWLASIKKGSIYSGNYAEYQKNLSIPAKLSTSVKEGSIITDIFCNPIGIGVKNGFLSKTYIKKFITASVTDFQPLKFVGFILDKNLIIKKILSKSIAEKYFIKTGSKVIKINGVKVFNKNMIEKYLKSNKNVTITIKQDGFDFTFKVKK